MRAARLPPVSRGFRADLLADSEVRSNSCFQPFLPPPNRLQCFRLECTQRRQAAFIRIPCHSDVSVLPWDVHATCLRKNGGAESADFAHNTHTLTFALELIYLNHGAKTSPPNPSRIQISLLLAVTNSRPLPFNVSLLRYVDGSSSSLVEHLLGPMLI